MANMSYCKFRNTLPDLEHCYAEMEEADSDEEQRARQRLVKLCKKIVDDYGDSYLVNSRG